ncbi:MAG: hypothetical protein LBU19_10150 [Treponema sp.]|nr:hypothetical protein [Treponema sp.]
MSSLDIPFIFGAPGSFVKTARLLPEGWKQALRRDHRRIVGIHQKI